MRPPIPVLTRDAWLLVIGQALRAFGYGLTAVLLGTVLAARRDGPVAAGVLLACVVAGAAAGSLAVAAAAERIGPRRCYVGFFVALAVAGGVVASDPPYWVLLVVGLCGVLSTDVVDNGPATTLEQAMLAEEDAGTARVYGWYNAAGAGAGALGALCAGLPFALTGAAHAQRWFLALTVVGSLGAVLAVGLSRPPVPPSAAGDAESDDKRPREPLPVAVRRLSGLFALDAAGGGFATTGFLSYLFATRYHASPSNVGALFFVVAVTQAVAVVIAPALARRYGLVPTMVGTHLPSNVLFAVVAFAPTFAVAAVLLVARTTLSQMDVPTRQALVMSVVPPDQRGRAAAVTNAARYTARPVGPVLAGLAQHLFLGAPLLVAGCVKGGYDLLLWRSARKLGLTEHPVAVMPA